MSKVFQAIASAVQARINCIANNNTEWRDKHEERAEILCKEFLPSGSGFDCGTKIDFDKSTGEKLVFTTSFHHMDENGMYGGWTEHEIIVTASLQFEISLRIIGRDRNNLKEMMYEQFQYALTREASLASA